MKALRGALVLVLLVVAWCAVLWWLIAPDFAAFGLPELGAIHLAPPLVAWGGGRFWLGRQRRRRAADAARADEDAEQGRSAAIEAMRLAHAAERERLHFGCDCRAVAIVLSDATGSASEIVMPDIDSIHFSASLPDDSVLEASLLDHLRPGIEEALGALYRRCPAALAFPIYLTPPSDVIGEQVIALVKEQRSRFIVAATEFVSPEATPGEGDHMVRFLPTADSAADSAIGLFEAAPELPGMVLLAFDSPWWRGQLDGQEDEASIGDEQGPSAQGVFALVLTHPRLTDMLSNRSRSTGSDDPMTPYWEKGGANVATPTCLERLTDRTVDALSGTEMLVRIHRGVSSITDAGNARRLELARDLEALIEQAQINSAQIDLLPSTLEVAELPIDSSVVPPSEPKEYDACGWLVHNSGTFSQGGHRLASLGAALFRRGLDLDLIDGATNTCAATGDLGQARQVAMLALTSAHAAARQCPALCVEFSNDNRLSAYFVMPQRLQA